MASEDEKPDQTQPSEPENLPGTELLKRSAELVKRDPNLAILSGAVSDPLRRAAMGLPRSGVDDLIASLAKADRFSVLGGLSEGVAETLQRAFTVQDPLREYSRIRPNCRNPWR